ncbi:receptor kinase-like protein Xa21 [Medicago truncatula]|uniref:receptor kinase-like protein Xa21 n=1 Tax=Medicago truncatula TaxID=3880 RepID=UPI0019676825|nr:receptor kinase-like protein Xa21 [Medicago truncatula]
MSNTVESYLSHYIIIPKKGKRWSDFIVPFCVAKTLLTFPGTIPKEIGYLDKFEVLYLPNNSLSGSISSKIFNLSSLTDLEVDLNSLSGTIPSNTGYSLPSLQYLYLNDNNFVGNIPNNIFNSSNLIEFQLDDNAFSGTLPNTAFGDLRFLESLFIYDNNLTIEDSHQFFTSLTNCRYLKYLELSGNHISNLPKSIGNITSEFFSAESCGIDGNIPQEVGNMSNLLTFSLFRNNITGPIPGTFKKLQKLQFLSLSNNGLQGSFIEEICEMKSLGELYLKNNKLSGVLPTCLGNMISLIRINVGSNSFNSRIPLSLWSLRDLLEINFSSNSLIGNLPPEIGNLRAIIRLDLSRNQISSNIPTTINSLLTLQSLSLADNKLNGSIPKSLGQMVSLISLDLSQNMLTGVIPKSLESLLYLQNINFSYNRLQGETPDGGHFKNFTAQSFMHNDALCGDPRLLVPLCGKQVKKWSMEKKLILKCILPIVVSAILVVACIIVLKHNKRRKNENTLEKGLSTLGAPRRISYYELVQATNGFSESNFLGRGGFGSVYQGKLLDGEMIAVKVIDLQSEAKSKSFDAECNAMRNLRHRNLVKIISSCSNLDFKSLVMEFMSNGSVDKWLYLNNYCLTFLQRLNIMIDVASALGYLHHGSSIPVVHCDLKPSNVLLDENMVAHVSDFGIAKLMDEGQSQTHTQTLATIGYLAPEYGSKGIVSVKGDVYSYGIMLMEIFTRKKPTDDMFVVELSLKTWISGSLPNSIMEVMDSNLVQITGDQIDDILTHMSYIFSLALNCCEDSPEARINMADVIATLIKIKTLVVGANTL